MKMIGINLRLYVPWQHINVVFPSMVQVVLSSVFAGNAKLVQCREPF